MARTKRSHGRSERRARVELSVSRLERHHVDALGADPLHEPATLLLAGREQGVVGLVASTDEGLPVGLARCATGDGRWVLTEVWVAEAERTRPVVDRLRDAAETLSLGRLTVSDQVAAQLTGAA